MVGKARNTQGKRDRAERFAVVNQTQLTYRLTQHFGPLTADVETCLGQHNSKFFAAIPACDVAAPHVALQDPAQVAQHRVTGFVTESVVEVFKIIDVDHDERQRQALALEAQQFTVEGFFKEAPVVGGG